MMQKLDINSRFFVFVNKTTAFSAKTIELFFPFSMERMADKNRLADKLTEEEVTILV